MAEERRRVVGGNQSKSEFQSLWNIPGSMALGQPASEIWDGEKRETGGVHFLRYLVTTRPLATFQLMGQALHPLDKRND